MLFIEGELVDVVDIVIVEVVEEFGYWFSMK